MSDQPASQAAAAEAQPSVRSENGGERAGGAPDAHVSGRIGPSTLDELHRRTVELKAMLARPAPPPQAPAPPVSPPPASPAAPRAVALSGQTLPDQHPTPPEARGRGGLPLTDLVARLEHLAARHELALRDAADAVHRLERVARRLESIAETGTTSEASSLAAALRDALALARSAPAGTGVAQEGARPARAPATRARRRSTPKEG